MPKRSSKNNTLLSFKSQPLFFYAARHITIGHLFFPFPGIFFVFAARGFAQPLGAPHLKHSSELGKFFVPHAPGEVVMLGFLRSFTKKNPQKKSNTTEIFQKGISPASKWCFVHIFGNGIWILRIMMGISKLGVSWYLGLRILAKFWILCWISIRSISVGVFLKS